MRPIKQICAHLNAFHAYADNPGQCVEANHFCSHLNEGKFLVKRPNVESGDGKPLHADGFRSPWLNRV
jgi:hypothetical protein